MTLCVVAASRLLAGVDLAADVGVAVMVGLALAYLEKSWTCCQRDATHVLRSPLLCAPGLVKSIPDVARLFCLALPGSFLNVLRAE